MIENLLKNQELKPYFFWLLKSRIKVALAAVIVAFQEKETDPKTEISATKDCKMAYTLLSIELIKLGVKLDNIPVLINTVTEHHLARHSIRAILDSTPELFIFPNYKNN